MAKRIFSAAKKIGVDTDKLLLSQPDYGEQALEIVEKALEMLRN